MKGAHKMYKREDLLRVLQVTDMQSACPSNMFNERAHKMHEREDLLRVLKVTDMQSAFAHFHSYSNICQVCFSHERDTRLRRCTKCKMVYYCGKNHQMQHWTSHKNFCKMATRLMEKFGGSNLFDKMNTENRMARINWKNRLVDLFEEGLKRKLVNHEKSLIFFPKLCAVCFENDPNLLRFCPKCPHASFCEEHFGDESHIEFCHLFTQGILLNAMGLTFKAGPIPGIIESVPHNTKQESLPVGMQYFLEHYCKCKKSILKVYKRSEIQMYMSEHFTRPLTLLYAMEKLRHPCQKIMTVHVIGANYFEEVGEKTWEVLLHWLPNLVSLRVIMIGPECQTQFNQIQVCRLCKAKGKSLSVESHGLIYKDYWEDEAFTMPDIIIGFNVGLRTYYDTWTDSLFMLTKVNCPFIITTTWESDIDADHEIMLRVLGHSARFTCRERNPFASLRPYRDVVNISVFFRNVGILIYTKLGQKEVETKSSGLFLSDQIKFEQKNSGLSFQSAEIW